MDYKNEFEHEKEFFEPDELEEAMDEAFIELIRQTKEEDDRAGIIRIPNPKRLYEMIVAREKIARIADEENFHVKMECGIEPLAYAGFIRLKCPYGFEVTNVPEFCKALKVASNIEFVMENDAVQIGIVFYGIFESRRLS